jgi:hypothetical protein
MLLTGLLRARVECDVRVRDVSHVDVPDSNRIGCASFELPADAILATMLESIRKGGLPLEVLGETRPQLDDSAIVRYGRRARFRSEALPKALINAGRN